MAEKEYLENLVVLQFAPNNCYPQVIEARTALDKYPPLKIDIDKKTWNYGRNAANKKVGSSNSKNL
jgi:hypothetical protein